MGGRGWLERLNRCGGLPAIFPQSILEQCRWPNAAMLNRASHSMAQEELAANFANTPESKKPKGFACFRVDSRSVFFGYCYLPIASP